MSKFGLVNSGTNIVSGPSGSLPTVAYALSNTTGELSVIDYADDPTDLTAPAVVGSCYINSAATKFAKAGDDYVYIFRSTNTVDIVDVQDPTDPYTCGSVRNGQLADIFDMVIVDDYLVCASGANDSIVVIDVNNPCNPMIKFVLQDSTKLNNVTSIKVVGSYMYTACVSTTGNFSIWDISNPVSITHVGEVVDTTNAISIIGIEVVGDYAYLLGTDWFNVFDVTVKTAPSFVGRFGDATVIDLSQAIRYVEQNGADYLLIAADTSDNISIWDISTPNTPVLTLDYQPTQIVAGISWMEVVGDYMYVADTDDIWLFDISTITSPSFVHQYTTTPAVSLGSFAVKGALPSTTTNGRLLPNPGDVTGPIDPRMYVNTTNGMVHIDISDPAIPVLEEMVTASAIPVFVVVDDLLYAYHEAATSIGIYDYSVPSAPKLIGVFQDASLLLITDMVFKDKHLICCTDSLGLIVIDVNDLNNMSIVETFDDGAYMDAVRDIVLHGDYLHGVSAADDTYYILDVTDPANISPVGVLELMLGATADNVFDQAASLTVNGTHAYLGSNDGNDRKLCVVNHTNKSAPFVEPYMGDDILNYNYYSYTPKMTTYGNYTVSTSDALNRTYSGTLILDTNTTPEHPECISYLPDSAVGTLDSVLLSGTNFVGVDVVDKELYVYDVTDVTTLNRQAPSVTVDAMLGGTQNVAQLVQSRHPGRVSSTEAPNPAPTYTGSINTGNSASLLFSAGGNEIVAIDITDPTNILKVASEALTAVDRIVVKDNYLFATVVGSDKIVSYDVTNAATGTITKLHEFIDGTSLNGALSLIIKGNTAFVACTVGNMITAVDISNPAAMTIKSSSLVDAVNLDDVRDLRFDPSNSNILIAAVNDDDKCVSINISNENNIVVANWSDADTTNCDLPQSTAVKDSIAYLGCKLDGVCVIDTTTSPMTRVKNLSQDVTMLSNSIEAMFVHGDYLFVCDTNLDMITLYDVSLSSDPKFMYVLAGMEATRGGIVIGNYGYFCSESATTGTVVIDFTDMSSPVKLANGVSHIGDSITYSNDPLLVK